MSTVTACSACRTAVPANQQRCLRCGHTVAEPSPAVPAPADTTGPPVAISSPPIAATGPVDTSGVFLDPRSHRGHLLVVAVVLGALILALVPLKAVEWFFFRPQSTVKAYFDALADRDAARAARLTSSSEDMDELEVLDPAALRSSRYIPPTDVRIDTVKTTEKDTAVAAVSFALAGQRRELSLTLRRDSHATAGLFRRWRIVGGRYPIGVRAPGVDEVVVAGVPARLDEGSYEVALLAFPGGYSVTLPEQPLLTAPETTLYAGVAGHKGVSSMAQIEPTVAANAVSEIERQVHEYLDDCAASNEPEPEGCPFAVGYTIGEVKDLQWRITSYPTITVELDPYRSGQVTVHTTGYGEVEATWREVFSDGTSFNEDDTDMFYVSGVVAMTGDKLSFRVVD